MRSIAVFLVFLFWVGSGFGAEYSPLPESISIGKAPEAAVPFDLNGLRAKWRSRIAAIKSKGVLPLIDVESSFTPGKVDAKDYAEAMDDNGVALIAFSPQIGKAQYSKNRTLWHEGARRAVGADPYRYIPTSTAGIYPAWTEEPEAFLQATIEKVKQDNYPMMGEFEFRHYLSPRQYKRGETFRDVNIKLNSKVGHQLFKFAEQSGISFQIHYEIEDGLLPALEEMLARYPKAKVIWCHLGQVRYSDRAKKYSPGYVRKLMEKYPNLYFDLAFGGVNSVYPGSGERHARVWDDAGRVKQAWVDLIAGHPYRFMSALDIGGDRTERLPENTRTLRDFMGNLPENAREIVGYQAAWKLVFNEDI